MIYLLRHPRPAVEEGICYGALDLDLAEPVDAIVERIKRLLPARYTVYSSPLIRALHLAKHFGDPIIDSRLKEMDFGEWEGMDFGSISDGIAEWARDVFGFRPPGGESAREMGDRVRAFLRSYTRSGPTLIVAHAGPIRAITTELLGLGEEEALRFRVDFGSLSAVREGELIFLNR